MADTGAEALKILLESGDSVSALLQRPPEARAALVLGHGAGAGMSHPFLSSAARELETRGVATLRYQFPYMERRSKRPDSPKIAQGAVRAAAAEAARLLPEVPLFAGGKSFGGRMTSQAQAESPLSGVRGLVFLGFPLHAPGKPSDERGRHLLDVKVPMLFLQGSRDEFAELDLLEPLVARLGPRATLRLVPEANHSFKVPARAGRKDSEILAELAAAIAEWIARILKEA
jgi:predicted alpha/beta-hydrolase family hydrolase